MNKNLRANRFYTFFFTHFRRQLRVLAALTALIVVGVAAGSFNPFVYGKIIDAVTTGQLDTVKTFIAVYFCVNLGAMLLSLLESYLGQIISYHVGSGVRRGLFTKIIRMRFKNLDGYPAGELMSRLDSDADAVVNYYINVITSIAMIAFNLVASVYFVFAISARLSLVAIFYIPASAAVTLFFRKKFRVLEKMQRVYFDKYMGFVNERFNHIRGLRAYRLEDASELKFAGFIDERLALIKKSIRLGNAMTILSHIISSGFNMATLYFSAKFIIDGTLTVGSMVAFSTYISKLYDVVSRILSMNMNAQGVIVSMDRLEKLQSEPDERPLYEGIGVTPKRVTGVVIHDLCFSYAEDAVLNHLSMQCRQPGLYAIVGKNGSGKSTLLKILMGFYDGEGHIAFDTDTGHRYTMRDLGIKQLRTKINYLSKEVFILNDTLLNNLKIAEPQLSEDDIIDICTTIGYARFVDTLPEKYQTLLSENGARFSSGQKQTLSAVRAYLSRSDIILLDEITSDLDGIAENEIISLIKDLAKTRVVLFVSHKITSVTDSDRIFLFDEGRITDEGAHDELMARSELYRQLFWLEKASEG